MSDALQSEAAECGLACVAYVAQQHGCQLGLRELRQQFSLSLRGARLDQVISIATRLGMATRALRVELEDMGSLQRPCILHWNLNHFVVLLRVNRRGITVFDPAFGERRLSSAEASRHFSGVALELSPSPGFGGARKEVPRITLRQLTGPIRGLGGSLGSILATSMVLQLLLIVAPLYLQLVIDQVLVSSDRDLLTVLGVGFLLFLLFQVAVGWLRGWSVVFVSSKLGMQWTLNVVQHMLKLPLDFFQKRHLGDVTSRIGSVQAIQQTITTSFVEAIIDGLMATVTVVLMLLYSWKLAAVTIFAAMLYAGMRAVNYHRVRSITEQQLMAGALQQTHLVETIRGMQSIKVSCGENQRLGSFHNLLNATVNHGVRLARNGLVFSSANQLLFGGERLIVIWLGALAALGGEFTVGMLIAYLAYKEQFSSRAGSLIDKAIEFRMLKLHSERLADILLTAGDPAAELSSDGAEIATPTRIVVENVSFRYAEGEPWILRDCSFIVEAGESVAIVGASGSGKTTLMGLMLGLLSPCEGSVRISGVDMHGTEARRVRAKLGAVMQDDQLFGGSVADNISGFSSYPDSERIEACARLAGIHDEIAQMPMQYQTLVGDMGSTFSGGQKQRCILARALYRQPDILFLDEATSHLDVRTEAMVNAALSKLRLTKVLIAHRPETIASADRIINLQDTRAQAVELVA